MQLKLFLMLFFMGGMPGTIQFSYCVSEENNSEERTLSREKLIKLAKDCQSNFLAYFSKLCAEDSDNVETIIQAILSDDEISKKAKHNLARHMLDIKKGYLRVIKRRGLPSPMYEFDRIRPDLPSRWQELIDGEGEK